MNINIGKYLVENGEQIKDFSQLKPGEFYALGWGKDGYKAFEMPSSSKTQRNNGSLTLRDIIIYQKPCKNSDAERVRGTIQLDELIHLELTGLVELNQDNEMRKNIKKGLKNSS